MAVTFSNPGGVHPPLPSYRHAALVENPRRRLVLAGQVGTRPDGTLSPDGGEQLAQIFTNIRIILAAHGMGMRDIVKMTVFLTDRLLLAPLRLAREAAMEGHAPASTLLIVAGLASPDYLAEIDVEAAD